MKQKMKNRFAALGTAVLLTQCTALPCFAGEQLGQCDFNDGVGLPWHICESATGKMDFTIDGGTYNITIENPGGVSGGGEDRWDCQFRHRNLTLVSGHTYRLTYSVWASNSGWMYAKLGDMTNDDAELWHSNGSLLNVTFQEGASQADIENALRSAQPNGQWGDYNQWQGVDINGNTWNTFAYEFTLGSNGERASQANGTGEWTFHFGGDGQYTPRVCFPAGTQLKFDNLALIDVTGDENDYVHEPEWQRADILTNQVGYFTRMAKKATLLSTSDKPVKFDLKDSSGKSVFSGESQVFGFDKDSGDSVHILDFSDFTQEGTFTLETAEGAVSRAFSVGVREQYSSMLYDALNYFYQNRSGIPIEAQYITSGDAQKLSRAAGHTSDNARIEQTWGYTASSGSQDVTGGWYDAGDHGKYVVNGGISLWLMQNQYERALQRGTADAYADGTMNIPENSNGFPDLLDEARYEMEWMLKMIVRDGECKDMVYHKVHDIKWTALATAPADDDKERILKPPTTAATLNLAACGAQSYRLWKDLDPTFAEQCLTAAKAAFEAAKAHPDMYAPLDESIGGGPYGDNDVSDEMYWAACELYAATGDDYYEKPIQTGTTAFAVPTSLTGGEAAGIPGSFDWGHTAALGTLTLALHTDMLNSTDAAKIEENLTSAANYYLELEKQQGFGLPYGQSQISYDDSDSGYIWGSNSVVADNAIILAYAGDMTNKPDYLNGVVSAVDYLLGRNAMDYSYVTGYGTHSVQYPHHRWWSNLLSDAYPKAPCGVLVGGPNSGMEDPWVRGSGWKKGQIPPQKCYLDHIEAWSVNECTINWNTPLCWLTSYLCEQDGGILKKTVSLAVNDGGSAEPNTQSVYDTQAASEIAERAIAETKVETAPPAVSTSEPEQKSASNSNVPWIVGGVLAGLISLEVFAYVIIKMLRK
ncbi:MAG: glycoside hydrolase family 9 protein [Oscillospiraceae bacterium]|nr:glycoside hydrolase family 9 protein [Oscillospiraceae bacterium]